MEKLTYRQAYDKIMDAYFKDEINPEDTKFCFCGTLCNNKISWAIGFRQRYHFYTFIEYGRMEKALFSAWPEIKWEYNGSIDNPIWHFEQEMDYEEKLFSGMCASLEILKQIHRERGENVDELPALTKRVLKSLYEMG